MIKEWTKNQFFVFNSFDFKNLLKIKLNIFQLLNNSYVSVLFILTFYFKNFKNQFAKFCIFLYLALLILNYKMGRQYNKN